MRKAAKDMGGHYIEVGYDDRVAFKPAREGRGRLDVIATWQRSQGRWTDHPVFRGVTITQVIKWLRGDDCDV